MTQIPLSLLSDNSTIDSNGQLVIAGVNVVDLANEYGTPVFIYDEDHIRVRCQQIVERFGTLGSYASKAFLCKYMAQVVASEGMGIDCASGGELYICLQAGVDPKSITFHGNNKSVEELEMAVSAGVGRIVIDCFEEIDRLELIYNKGLSPIPPVLIRITPGVKVETHKFISTGQDDSKFGFNVSRGDAQLAIEKVQSSEYLNLVGVHAHIGSQVFDVGSFAKAVEIMADLINPYDMEEFIVGGGIGVGYVEGEVTPSLKDWADSILETAKKSGVKAKIGVEPGRGIVASSAITVYTVGVIKNIPDVRTYIAVDGGMSDNPRPVLYDSGYEAFNPADVLNDRSATARIVGKHCESGDVLINEASVPSNLKVGDLLATPVTGAYGYSLSSNYNGIRRSPILFVKDGSVKVARRRETYDDLLIADMI